MKTCIIAAASLSFSLLAGAHAGDLQSAKVRLADLDLNSGLCRAWDSRNGVFSDLKPEMAQYQGCLEKTIARAAAKMNQPAFTGYVDSQMSFPDALTNIRFAAK
jgi:hypothetical protein